MKLTNIVKNLLIINIIAFALTAIIGDSIFLNFAAWSPLSANFGVYQMITYMFLHGGPTHIIFNMLGLIVFGPTCERYLGSVNFLNFYLISGVISALAHFIMNIHSEIPLVGASGAIYGVLFLFIMSNPSENLYLFFIPIGIKAKYLGTAILAYEIVSGFVSHDNVAHFGHVGGALAGISMFFISREK